VLKELLVHRVPKVILVRKEQQVLKALKVI
jgi:hypothetical protein